MRRQGRPVQWLGFACVVLACLVFSVGAGVWIVRATTPVEVGRGGVGSWAELADSGLRVRLDDVDMAPSYRSAFNPDREVVAPEGFEFLRVRMTVEVHGGPDVAMGCLVQLRNRDGEEVGNRGVGTEGPPRADCDYGAYFDENGASVSESDQFESQSVFIVLPDELDSFTLDIVPWLAQGDVFWTFDLA